LHVSREGHQAESEASPAIRDLQKPS